MGGKRAENATVSKAMTTTDDDVEQWAKEIMKTGIWMAEEKKGETIVESGIGKFKIPKPLANVTKNDVLFALRPEVIQEKWKEHGHGHDAHGNDIPLTGHEGLDGLEHGHDHEGHSHDGHEGHGHAHDDGHGHAHDHAGGDCCGGHGEGHDAKEGHSHGGHGDEGHGHGHGHSHGHKDGEGSAKIVGVGVVKLAGETFSVDREGQCEGGKTCEFGVERVGPGTAEGFEAWVENAAGERVSEVVKAESHGVHWHCMVTPQADAQASKFALRLETAVDKIDIHPGAAPCHDGISSPIYDKSGSIAGFLELKLHDDAGDLELWISHDGAMTQPMDIPADTVITASFLAYEGRSVNLKVRNRGQNEDEDKQPNMRDGKTNYFIFPGDTGDDPSWLKGEKFRSMVKVTFSVGDQAYETHPFIIVGHSQY